MWWLSRVGRDRLPFAEAFNLDLPSSGMTPARTSPPDACKAVYRDGVRGHRRAAGRFATGWTHGDPPPSRRIFHFPMNLDEWQGKQGRIEGIYLDVLKLDDYLMADFVNPRKEVINFYVAYYSSQRKGESRIHRAHAYREEAGRSRRSPREKLTVFMVNGAPLNVNRVIIQKGDLRQLVYYWFQQRGRNMTNEYLVKWYIFWDALTRNRTDGALVRLTAFVPPSRIWPRWIGCLPISVGRSLTRSGIMYRNSPRFRPGFSTIQSR
jgi:EpsI family protein